MQKLPRSLERLKNLVNSSKNRNIRFVNVRDVRQCKYCGNLIGVDHIAFNSVLVVAQYFSIIYLRWCYF